IRKDAAAMWGVGCQIGVAGLLRSHGGITQLGRWRATRFAVEDALASVMVGVHNRAVLRGFLGPAGYSHHNSLKESCGSGLVSIVRRLSFYRQPIGHFRLSVHLSMCCVIDERTSSWRKVVSEYGKCVQDIGTRRISQQRGCEPVLLTKEAPEFRRVVQRSLEF